MPFELDPKALRYFLAVASKKSFTRAAAHLHVTQPVVTRQIQAIEGEYGVRLFRREGQSMTLTEAGEVLFEQATDILQRLDAIGAQLKDAAREPTGSVSIGAPTATGEVLLPPILTEYRRKYPKVLVRVFSGYTGDLAEMLVDGQLDLALVFGRPSHADLEFRPLFDIELGLIASVSWAAPKGLLHGRKSISLQEAAALPLILPSRAHGLTKLIEQACREIGVQPNVVMVADAASVARALVRQGAGCMIMGADGVRAELEQQQVLFVPLEPTLRMPLSIATRRSKASNLACRTMFAEIIQGTETGSFSGTAQARH